MDAFLSTRRGFWMAVFVMFMLAAVLIPVIAAGLQELVDPTPTTYHIERDLRGNIIEVTIR